MITEHAYAKLNLALNVVRKRSDGYHDLEMIVMPLTLSDILTFEIGKDVSLESDIHIHDNAVLKTALYIKQKYDVDKGVTIKLKKRIPIGSGLGGESADIAATIRGLNRLWNLELNAQALEHIALALGSDTVFCLYNKTALVTGRGEHIKFLQNPPINHVYLFISEHPISTRESFIHYTPNRTEISFKMLLEAYQSAAYETFFNKAFNGLLETAFILDKTLKKAYITLKNKYKNAYMTGSGSTLFILEFSKKIFDFNEIQLISSRKVIKTTPFI